jgi:uncharacterized delta-60 repeat protein
MHNAPLMKNRVLTLLFFAFLQYSYVLYAQIGQPGQLDTSFNFGGISRDFFTNLNNPEPGIGSNGSVNCILLQPDGKILLAGLFTSYNGLIRNRMARIHSDGSLDSSFNSGTGTSNNRIFSMALQTDGKVLIAGNFTFYNGTSRNRIARIDSHGRIDSSFNPGLGANGIVRAVALQPDGKVLIAGEFTTVNGVSRNRIARLNGDGSLDASFNPGTGANGVVRALVLQADGKIILGGGFTSLNAMVSNQVARLNADGTVDLSFNAGSGLTGPTSPMIYFMSLQADGKLLIGGEFSTYSGFTRNNIARIGSNGSIDTTFNPGSGANGTVQCIQLQPNGGVFISGDFTNFDGASINRIARLTPNGSLDTSFNPGIGTSQSIVNLALQPDSKLIIAGDFALYNGVSINRIARIQNNGNIDPGFNRITGANNRVNAVAYQPDGKIIVAGEFTNFNGVVQGRISRLLPNGSLDTSFFSGTGANNYVSNLLLQPDGKILLVGLINSFDGVACGSVARLHPNGRLDTSFIRVPGVVGPVQCAAIQHDGKIVIGGALVSVNGIMQRGIARLLPDGSYDSSFVVGTGVNTDVSAIVIQPDGKIVIGGFFTSYNGVQSNRLARLLTDGSIDTTFNTGSGPNNNSVQALALQPDGKILVGGNFLSFNGVQISRMVRLNPNGSVDPTFNQGNGVSGLVTAMSYQPDGKVIIGGEFSTVHGIARNGFARLLADGNLDTTFNPSAAARGFAVQPDGKMVVGGSFLKFNGEFRSRVARIYTANCSITPTNYTSRSTICPGSSKNLVGTPGSNWVIAHGPGSIQGTTYIASSDTGIVWVYNQIGDCLSEMVSFRVAVPDAPVVANPSPICPGNSVTIFPIRGGASYRFYASSTSSVPLPGGNGVQSFTTPTLLANTSFYVSAVSDSGCESLERKEVRAILFPTPNVSIRLQNNTLVADSLLGSYQWYLNNVALVGETRNILIPVATGAYSVQVTNSFGCSDTSNVIQFNVLNTAPLQQEPFKWSTFPVPFDEQLVIRADLPFRYELLDVHGRLLLNGESEQPNLTLQTQHLTNGMYFVKVNLNGQIAVRRVMKQ